MDKIYIVEGEVTDAEAHNYNAPLGATEWQFSDGPPGARASSADYLSLEQGMREQAARHPGAHFIFIPSYKDH